MKARAHSCCHTVTAQSRPTLPSHTSSNFKLISGDLQQNAPHQQTSAAAQLLSCSPSSCIAHPCLSAYSKSSQAMDTPAAHRSISNTQRYARWCDSGAKSSAGASSLAATSSTSSRLPPPTSILDGTGTAAAAQSCCAGSCRGCHVSARPTRRTRRCSSCCGWRLVPGAE